MEWFNLHALTAITFFPFVWGLVGLIFPSRTYRSWVFVGSLLSFVLSLYLWFAFQSQGLEFQFQEKVTWIASFGVSYHLGIDGISLWLILLTTFLSPIVVLSSFQSIEHREKEYYFLLLALQTGMLGAFVALDLFLFYVFWEAMLIPMYFLIGIWGGKERVYAATKFFLYTVAGSLLMLVAIFYLIYQHKIQYGEYSASLLDLYRLTLSSVGGSFSTQGILFLGFAVAFAIKVPLFPLHTWLPDAHVQAPTAGSVILAGVLLKLGGYGFIRFAYPLFPQAVMQFQGLFLLLGAIAIIYGSWVAMVQPDIKKLVAYSSVSHMGFVIIGLFSLSSIGVTGSIYQMLNHGISTGALFLLVGMIYDRRHTREIKEFGGIAKVMPLFTVALMIITFSSIGLPGTNGFIGEFLILLGTWKTNALITAIAALGVVFGAIYMLWMVQRVLFGKINKRENEELTDLSGREIGILIPLIFLVFFMGIYPAFFFEKLEPAVHRFLARAGVQTSTPAAKIERFFVKWER